MRTEPRRSVGVVVGILFFAISAGHVFAAGLPTGAFIVSPAKEELTISKGETKTVNITLRNSTALPLIVTPTYEDIAPMEQKNSGDNPVKLLGTHDAANSLYQMISFPREKITILSGGEVSVPVTVEVPQNTTPGGKYGSVVWTFKEIKKEGESTPVNVALESRIASLFFVRVSGESKEEGQLVAFGLFNNAKTSPSPNKERPLRMQVAFENKGDVHLSPYGRITVSGILGSPKVLIVDPWAVLPGATRMREIDLFDPLMPGYYHAHLELNRGYGDIVDESDVTFWVMPTTLQTIVSLICFILVILLIRRSLALSRHRI